MRICSAVLHGIQACRWTLYVLIYIPQKFDECSSFFQHSQISISSGEAQSCQKGPEWWVSSDVKEQQYDSDRKLPMLGKREVKCLATAAFRLQTYTHWTQTLLFVKQQNGFTLRTRASGYAQIAYWFIGGWSLGIVDLNCSALWGSGSCDLYAMKSSMTEVDSLDCAGTQVVCLLVVTEQNRLSEGDATICTVRNNIKKN